MRRLPLLLAVLLPLAACDATGGLDQRQFEDDAYFLAPGQASTWRIGPAFDARIRFNTLPGNPPGPVPNPVGAQEEVSLVLDVAVPAPSGFALYRLAERAGVPELDLIAALPGQAQPWFYTFSFLGGEADAFGRAGTYRLVVLDANQRVVAFGDLTVR